MITLHRDLTVGQIKTALVLERENMTEAQMSMLEALLRNSSRSATQFAEAAGFKGGYSAVNLQFGIFSVRHARALGISPHGPVLNEVGREGKKGHWQLELKTDIREALQELRWFETTKPR